MQTFVPSDPDFDRRVRASFSRQNVMTLFQATLARVAPGHVDIDMAFKDGRTDIERNRESRYASWRSPAYDRDATRRLDYRPGSGSTMNGAGVASMSVW